MGNLLPKASLTGLCPAPHNVCLAGFSCRSASFDAGQIRGTHPQVVILGKTNGGSAETLLQLRRFIPTKFIFQEKIMDNDRVEGSMKNIKGSVKEGVGKAIGDTKLETEGKMDKASGKIQNTVGGIKDSLRGNRD
jgi:uncharacterized protein YjbJ (UPF0337 family)